MTWGNPPAFKPDPPKKGKAITPADLARGSEHGEQAALFAWAAMSVVKYPALAYMFAIPNGGARNDQTRMMLAAEGVKNGVPDIFLPAPIEYMQAQGWIIRHNGCFIEMKRAKYRNHKNGGCSEEQIEFIEWATSAGYYCKVCYSWEEAKDTLVNYLEGKL